MQRCVCGNSDRVKFNRYMDDEDDELLGVCCTPCGQEWLKNEYLNEAGEERLIFGTNEFKQQINPLQEVQESFQVKGSRTKIEWNDLNCLKPGDHITWHRPWVIWHHAIVVDIDPVNRKLQIIHWKKVKGHADKVQIEKEWINVDEEKGDLYRIDYTEDVIEKNPAKLALARAHSRIGETGYGLLEKNCEGLAAFCKTGVDESCQVQWLKGKIKEVGKTVAGQLAKAFPKAACIGVKEAIKSGAKHTLKEAGKITLEEAALSTGKVALAETVEKARHASNGVGAGIVIAIEGGFCIWDVSQLHQNRNDGKISEKDFAECASHRVIEALSAAGLAIGGSLAGEAIGGTAGAALGSALPIIGTGVGAAVGVFIGSVVGGALGSIGGKVVGSVMGPYVGKVIAMVIKRDDRAVTDINDLNVADQVVFYGWLLHPRHHAIVVDVDPSKGKVRVVHSLYSKGVVEEWVDFVKPVYKVVYKDHECYPADEVLRRARSKLGENEYSLMFKNCKDFARGCKEKK